MKSDVPLTRMDSALLEAVAGTWPPRRSITLRQLIESVSWDLDEIPTFDEASYGLARLMARGYVRATYSRTRGIRLSATQQGMAIRKEAVAYRQKTSPWRWPRRAEYSIAIAHVVGASARPGHEVDDISAGRFPRLTESEWTALVRAYRRDFARSAKAIERLFAPLTSLMKRRQGFRDGQPAAPSED